MPRLIAPYSVREHTIGDCNRTPSPPQTAYMFAFSRVRVLEPCTTKYLL
jgi:hypothetical protein